MKIAVPTYDGLLAAHFGHCAQFALVDADPDAREVRDVELVDAPMHEPGKLPGWLLERGVELVIAGGMGALAQSLFQEAGVPVIVGAPSEEPRDVVQSYLEETLATGDNTCAH